MNKDFSEFAKINRRFSIKGLPSIYKIINIFPDKIVIKLENSLINFNLDKNLAKDSFEIGMWNLVEEIDNLNSGIFCFKCKKYFEYANANQDDGTMICWSCRNGF